MLSMKCLQTLAVLLAAIGFGLAGTDASAGHDRDSRSCDRDSYSRVSATFGGDHYRVSVSVGSGGHYDRGRYDRDCDRGYGDRGHVTYSRTYHSERVYTAPVRYETQTVRYVETRPSGYWSQVYHPPVYETRYDRCGYPIRVCVREGYYERVWVSTGSCR